MEISVNGNDPEKALKLIKRKLQKDGFMQELKKRRFYEKPSVKIKSEQKLSRRRKTKNISRRIQATISQ